MQHDIRLLSVLAAAAMVASTACQSSILGKDSAARKSRRGQAEPTSQMQQVLDAHAFLEPKPIVDLAPVEARRQPSPGDALVQVLQMRGQLSPQPTPAVGRIETRMLPGAEEPLRARIYTPAGDGPFPVIVYFHGGGWVLGSIDAYDASCRALSTLSKAVVVSVDYRLAPEHKFPAAHEDCHAALQHVMANAVEYGGDPARVAVAGESVGGNLATAACLLAHQRGGRMPIHQLLIYPVTDSSFDTPSYREEADARPLDLAMMRWFFGHYLRSEADGASPLVSPLRADDGDLRALPPATLITAEIDPLRSEGQAYGKKLASLGVGVSSRNYPGVTHEFFGMAAVVDEARQAQEFAAGQLRRAFAGKRPGASTARGSR
jgi:acetyl esterase